LTPTTSPVLVTLAVLLGELVTAMAEMVEMAATLGEEETPVPRAVTPGVLVEETPGQEAAMLGVLAEATRMPTTGTAPLLLPLPGNLVRICHGHLSPTSVTDNHQH
jgi:hypothetical protein